MEIVPTPIKLRSYQNEMFQRSLEGNTIIVMETGSGKTPVALFRIIHALETGNNEKLIWFLTQSVALCRQQHEALYKFCPSARSKLIVGEDGPKLWGSEAVWDEVLAGVDVMFSTFDVLHQALSHAYVSITRLQMLVFDEAHHVTKKHPANKIMEKYHEERLLHRKLEMPSILGLTASPAENGNTNKIRTLESNMAATCRAPRKYRLELRNYVYRPSLTRLEYAANVDDHSYYHVIPVPLNPPLLDTAKVDKAIAKVHNKAEYLAKELGMWSVMTFLEELINSLSLKVDQPQAEYGILSTCEKKAILDALTTLLDKTRSLHALYLDNNTGLHVSAKVQCLIDRLNGLMACCDQAFIGIVFAQQRVTTAMLAKLLLNHPCVMRDFRPAAYVGESSFTAYSRELSELVITRTQSKVLDSFRKGDTNILIATDALDEGIDVAACNTIVCFDVPANVRSFIQKRGRARKERSTFTIMVPQGSELLSQKNFEALEEHMTRTVQEENDEVRRAQAKEAISENVELNLRSSIGACLAASEVRAHLEHYCAKLPRPPYTDTRPAFSCSEDDDGLIRAEVQLPMSVPSAVRIAKSLYGWRTERAAIIDAAFHAYKGLYEKSLLTEHLLPIDMQPKIDDNFEEHRLDFYHLDKKWCLWDDLSSSPLLDHVFRTSVSLYNRCTGWKGERIALWTGIDLSYVKNFLLSTTNDQEIIAEFHTTVRISLRSEEIIRLLASCTKTLLMAIRSNDIPLDERAAMFITPDLNMNELGAWLQQYDGYVPLEDAFSQADPAKLGLIVNTAQGNSLNLFQNWCHVEDDEGDKTFGVDTVPFPRRRNFLGLRPSHLAILDDEMISHDDSAVMLGKSFPASDCLIQRLPVSYAWTMRLMPSLFYQLEASLAADSLMMSILKGINFTVKDDLIASITSPSTGLQRNYERLEFLGDSLLKYHVSQQLFCTYPDWHEEHLTRERNTHIANISLAKAAVRIGLDKYILKDAFVGKNWMPPTASSVHKQSQQDRHVPTKTLADVVEAVIGAAFQSDGMQNARCCMSRLLPLLQKDPPDFTKIIWNIPSSQASVCDKNRLNERADCLIGYTFQNRGLLTEALTHPSCTKDRNTEPYQRLEFLGDAILDMLVVKLMFRWLPHASQSFMTKVKSTLVNADFLAYLCYSFHEVSESVFYTQKNESSPRERHIIHHDQDLWMLMRCGNESVATARKEGHVRFLNLREDINNRLRSGKAYPWEQLHMLHTPKFVSDIVESIIGAIFVDSNGNLEACLAFFEKLGAMQYLRRIVEEDVDVTHPYERLNRLSRGRKLVFSYQLNKLNEDLFDLDISDGDKVIASVSSCASREEAKIRAAGLACSFLEKDF